MADYSALTEAGEALVALLRENLTPEPLGNRELISLCSPHESENNQLTLYLSHIEEEAQSMTAGYYSVDSDKVDLSQNDYLYIGTLESYVKMRDYYGADKIIPIYIELDDGVRLERALNRERQQKEPGYAEMCRRFLTDSEDFSEENLKKAGIERRFDNTDLETCIREIRNEILRSGALS